VQIASFAPMAETESGSRSGESGAEAEQGLSVFLYLALAAAACAGLVGVAAFLLWRRGGAEAGRRSTGEE
jgi:hypothetical protein